MPSVAEIQAPTANKWHPVVSPVQFASLADTTGGATMNAVTGKATTAGDAGYAVGGAPSTVTGDKIPTEYVKSRTGNVELGEVMRQRKRVMAEQGGEATVGVWHDHEVAPEERTQEWDASQVTTLKRASSLGLRRRPAEKAIWDFKNMREIRLDREPRKRVLP